MSNKHLRRCQLVFCSCSFICSSNVRVNEKLKSHFVQEIKVILFTSSYCINCLVGICGGCNSNSNERAFFKKSLDGLDETQVSRHYHCLASNFRGLLQ